jgi:hypothetical protein
VAFEVQEGGVERLLPDGKIESTLAVSPAAFPPIASGPADPVQMDRTGTIVRNKRREKRFEAMKKLAEFRFRHSSDATTLKMLKSFADSIAKPEEALFCLYEIWDALMKKMGKKNAPIVLNNPQEDLITFRDITCNRPLRRSRHRGRNDTLHDATTRELDDARRIAKDMMEGYWKFLDDRQRAK